MALLALAAPAAAHVTLTPSRAEPGGPATLTLRVPNEREDARTVRVEVFLPEGQDVGAVEATAPAGWRSVVSGETVDFGSPEGVGGTDAVSFTVRVAGPLPEADRLLFKTLQHYSDGRVVRWIQEPAAGAERPAPALRLGAAAPADDEGGGSPVMWIALGVVVAVGAATGVVLLRRRR